MIRTDNELAIERKALGHIERALESLRADVETKNPRNFAIYSEGYVDQIDILKGEIDAYIARKKYNTPDMAFIAPINSNEAAVRAANEGVTALIAGETGRAAQCFAQAGGIIEASIANTRKQSEKHQLRLLAACLYFQGGQYRRVDLLCKRIGADLLPSNIRPSLVRVRTEAKHRKATNYRQSVMKNLVRSRGSGDFGRVTALLREHPYIMPPANLAFLRAICCERLKDYQAAAVFFADSWRLAPSLLENPKVVFLTAGLAHLLIHEGRLCEAAKCVQYQLEHIPHAATFVNASLLRYHQAIATKDDWRRPILIEEQLEFCDEAFRRYQQLPIQVRDEGDLKLLMTHCLQCAALAAHHANKDVSLRLANTTIEFNPTFWGPWTTRGLITYPERSAIADFAKAAQFNDISWHPYYYLALDSLMQDRYSDAAAWAEKALQHGPSTRARAQMLMAIGIAKMNLGPQANQTRIYFEEAIQLAPSDPWVKLNWDIYRAAINDVVVSPIFERHIKPLETRDEYLARQLNEVDKRREQQNVASLALPLAS